MCCWSVCWCLFGAAVCILIVCCCCVVCVLSTRCQRVVDVFVDCVFVGMFLVGGSTCDVGMFLVVDSVFVCTLLVCC